VTKHEVGDPQRVPRAEPLEGGHDCFELVLDSSQVLCRCPTRGACGSSPYGKLQEGEPVLIICGDGIVDDSSAAVDPIDRRKVGQPNHDFQSGGLEQVTQPDIRIGRFLFVLLTIEEQL